MDLFCSFKEEVYQGGEVSHETVCSTMHTQGMVICMRYCPLTCI